MYEIKIKYKMYFTCDKGKNSSFQKIFRIGRTTEGILTIVGKESFLQNLFRSDHDYFEIALSLVFNVLSEK